MNGTEWAELRAATNPFNVVGRPVAWLEWRRRHGYVDDGMAPPACPGSGGSTSAPGQTKPQTYVVGSHVPTTRSDGPAPGYVGASQPGVAMGFSPYHPVSGGSASAPGLVAPPCPDHETTVSAEYVSTGNPFLGVPSPLNVARHPATSANWGYPPCHRAASVRGLRNRVPRR